MNVSKLQKHLQLSLLVIMLELNCLTKNKITNLTNTEKCVCNFDTFIYYSGSLSHVHRLKLFTHCHILLVKS